MLIYLASPYSHADPAIRAQRFDAACIATAALMKAGAHVISPIAASHPVALAGGGELLGPYAYWQALDHELIDACGELWILCLPGWDASIGVADEIAYAREHGKTLRFVEPGDVTAPLRAAQPVRLEPAPPPPATPAAVGTNPKDRLGAAKVSLSKLPPVAVAHGAHAMMNGAAKYGAYNWRGNAVIASIYVDACMRHVAAWFDGEELADDSGVHHLGHALACCAILLDAQATGNLVDDRPKGGAFAATLARLNATISAARGAR